MQTYFTPTRLEFKGWRDWNDVQGSAIDLIEVGSLVASLKAKMPMDLPDRSDPTP